MDHFLAVVPSILALIAFVLVIRLMVNSDRIERRAEAKFDAQMKARHSEADQATETSAAAGEDTDTPGAHPSQPPTAR